MEYEERNMIDIYASVFNSLSVFSKIELMERLLKSLKNENTNEELTGEFIPEKTAEQIIEEIRESRNFGKTRIIEML
jgi:hypothetical protein